jgi:hypothetical protein
MLSDIISANSTVAIFVIRTNLKKSYKVHIPSPISSLDIAIKPKSEQGFRAFAMKGSVLCAF